MNIEELIIRLPEHADSRGVLCVAENHDLPFTVRRVFWIYDIESGQSRGGHAHTRCEEVVFAIHGSFDMIIDDGTERACVRIDSPDKGIYIRKNVWCELTNFSPGTICMALASEPYDTDGYMKDYDEFLRSRHQ